MNLAVSWEIPGVTANPTKDVPLFEDPNTHERYLSQEEVQRHGPSSAGLEAPVNALFLGHCTSSSRT
jgi:hypothetical protein